MTALRHLPDRRCEFCTVKFRPRRQEQRFCCRECWLAFARKNYKKCLHCGKEMHAKHSGQKYCSVACANLAKTKDKTVICAVCGVSFERPHGKTRAYCSRSCANKARYMGLKKPEITLDKRIIGQKIINTHGYVLVRYNGKKVLEHRLVMEQVIGRPLTKDEYVHHINGNRQDNRPENLELWTKTNDDKKDPHGIRVVDKVINLIKLLNIEEKRKVFNMLQDYVKV